MKKSSKKSMKGGVHGSSIGKQNGGKLGAMQTPARLATSRKISGRR